MSEKYWFKPESDIEHEGQIHKCYSVYEAEKLPNGSISCQLLHQAEVMLKGQSYQELEQEYETAKANKKLNFVKYHSPYFYGTPINVPHGEEE